MTERGASYDELSLGELLKPLSASKAPEEAFVTWFGKAEVSGARVAANQRNAVANKVRTIERAAIKAIKGNGQ